MISVIIPLYNAASTIEKALDSVKNQTWSGLFEIIVVNDGSTDNSESAVASYIKQHPELNIYYLEQENKGVSAARNAGLQVAAGDYIALLDADDEWLPEKTERQIAFLHNPHQDVDFIAARIVGHHLKYPYLVKGTNFAEITFRKLMLRNEARTSSVIFRKEILKTTGFFPHNQRYAEDINYWLRISLSHSMYILDEELLVCGEGKRSFGVSGLSANLKEMERGFTRNLQEMLNLKKINAAEFMFYYLFNKAKYIIRLGRNLFYKSLGK